MFLINNTGLKLFLFTFICALAMNGEGRNREILVFDLK